MLRGAAFFLPLSRWLAVSTALPVSAVVPSAIATILLSISAALPTIVTILLSFSTTLPIIAPSLLSFSTVLLSISVGMGMASAAPEGVLARLETMSVGFWLTAFYVPVNSISLNWFGGVAVNHLLCKCNHLHRVSRYRCRDGDGLGWLVTYDTRPRAY